MVAHRRRLAATVAAVAAALCVGATVAVAQQDDDAPSGSGDDALLARLDALEQQLPTEVAPTSVTLEDGDTWGSFDGDVTGAAATLATLEGDLRTLYADADDATGDVAEAVAAVARGWLDLRHGLDQLAAWEAHDLALPIDARDDDGVATDADQLRGPAESGLRLVLGARQRHLAGYVALREAGVAEPDVQQRLDARAAEAEAFDQDVRPLVHELLSLRTTGVLVPVDRFETAAPGVEARARSFTVVCVDRQAQSEVEVQVTPEGGVDLDELTAAVDDLTAGANRADCPDLPADQAVRVEGEDAGDADGDE